MWLAESFVTIFTGYAIVGIVFAIAFAAVGVNQLDPLARGAGWGFRLLMLPGAAAFWPLLLLRWAKGNR